MLQHVRQLGAAVRLQAWHCKRMISLFNRACGRPHLPKEKWLQEMMVELGISISSRPPRPETAESSDDDEDPEEGGEEEEATEDEMYCEDEDCMHESYVCFPM